MPQPKNSRQLKLILHALFLISGTVTVLIGPLLPILARHYSLNDLQVGFYFPAQFAGSLFGTFLTSRWARGDEFLKASMVGSLLMAIGVLSMNVDSFPFSLFSFFLTGMGIGLTLPAIHMKIIELSPINTASALSILNFCWGVGAIFCQPFVNFSGRGGNILQTTVALAVPLFITGIFLFFQAERATTADGSPHTQSDTPDIPIWTMPLAWAIALFNFIHVGFESSMGGWLATYTERLDNAAATSWLSPTLSYFVLFVVGRGVAPLLFTFLSENKMLLLGLLTVLTGMILTVTASSVELLTIGASVAGFGTSWVFPTNLSRFTKAFGPTAARRATPIFVCGTLGAAASTWMIGFVSNQTGNLRSGMYVLVVSILILIVIQVGLSLRRGSI